MWLLVHRIQPLSLKGRVGQYGGSAPAMTRRAPRSALKERPAVNGAHRRPTTRLRAGSAHRCGRVSRLLLRNGSITCIPPLPACSGRAVIGARRGLTGLLDSLSSSLDRTREEAGQRLIALDQLLGLWAWDLAFDVSTSRVKRFRR